ncbi:hypothetical protein E5D57_004451 [Metarhizium anisopliae]|nr:hypothetical protein E5D57_004451 [Metarhizium anisopliae]
MSSTNIDIDLRVEEAVRYLGNNPTAGQRSVAKKFNVPRDRVRRRLSGVPPKQGCHASNAWLTEPEEVALCRYVDRLDMMNLSIRKEFVKDAANLILRERTEETPQPTVGPKWVDRFIKRHNYSVLSQKIRDSSRQNAESVEKVTNYFEQLHDCICEHGIVDSDIWNMDETRFWIGALKESTILSAFQKTGIVPWNPQPIIDLIRRLHPAPASEITTPPPTNQLSSSPFNTPYTLRQLSKVATRIDDLQDALGELQPALKSEMDRFIRGALVQSTELRQAMRDLSRTRMAEELRKKRKACRNRPLQHGGVIMVADGRKMVRRSDHKEEEAARQMLDRVAMRRHNAMKRAFEAAAKAARKRRLAGALKPLYIVDSNGGGRHLRRG